MPVGSFKASVGDAEESLFIRKTARSIAEIQPNLDTLADIAVFLEILGYTDESVAKHGFRDIFAFAAEVYDYTDHYSDGGAAKRAQEKAVMVPVPSVGRRLGRGLSLTFPWVGSLFVLLVFGVSLWLAFGLPISITTSMLVGVFLGVLASEGPMQLFQRLFVFHFDQGNMPELRRVLRRSYGLVALLGATILGVLFLAGIALNIPINLVEFAAAVAVAVLVHRVSYVVVYALRKFAQLVASYALGLTTLLAAYFLLYDLVPHTLTRYLTALSLALVVLSVVPAYYSYKVATSKSAAPLDDKKRNRLHPVVANAKTIRSHFHIQFWEEGPFYLFGTLFFCMLFGDRIISWVFNPNHLVNGIELPMVFNPVYHMGADLALFVIFPAAVVQYAVMGGLSEELSNLGITWDVRETGKIDQFIARKYSLLLFASLGVSGTIGIFLVLFAPQIMANFGASSVSETVLRFAAIGNILMSIFMANSIMLVFLNKVKALTVITLAGVCVLGVLGTLYAPYGVQNIVYAYCLAAALAAIVSSSLVETVLKEASAIHFSRYM